MRFYYVMVVWGNDYVQMLLDVALPCLLAPGNLSGTSNIADSRFLLITTAADRARIENSPVFAKLNELIQTEIIVPAWICEAIPYWLKAARGHQLAAELAAKDSAYCIYLAPDFILSDGSLRSLVEQAACGKTAVLVPGIRVVTETVVPELLEAYSTGLSAPLSVASRDLVALCLKHVHPENQRYDWHHPNFSECPVVCTWSVPEENGLLIRAFHLHPLMLRITDVESIRLLHSNTIDGEFLGLNCPDWDGVHVETDSDQIALFSLTSRIDRIQPTKANVANVELLRTLAYSSVVNPLHRYYFTKAIKLHSRNLNDKWSALERQTAQIVYQALSYSMPSAFGAASSDALHFISAKLMAREVVRRAARRIAREVLYFLRLLWKRTKLTGR